MMYGQALATVIRDDSSDTFDLLEKFTSAFAKGERTISSLEASGDSTLYCSKQNVNMI